MALSPRLIALLSYLLVAGGILLQFFIILSGYVTTTPIGKTYFLRADTANIPNAPEQARWTFLAICGHEGSSSGRNANCRSTHAALPFDPPRNFDTTQNIPSAFLDTHYYYYMSRFAFAFYLIALFFAVCTLVSGLLALCLTRIGSFLSILLVGSAWFFQALAAVLMTVWSVKGRNRFKSNGQSAHIGQYAYGFTWGAFACFSLCIVLYFVELFMDRSAAAGVRRTHSTRSRRSGAFEVNEVNPEKSSFERNRA